MLFFRTLFRGIGQIILQNNALSGVLIFLGISIQSLEIALATLVGSLIGSLSALLLKYSKEDIENGIYGFNGALVGAASVFFLELRLSTFCILVVGSLASSILHHYLAKKMKAYTGSFVLLTWLIVYSFWFFTETKLSTNTTVVSHLDLVSAVFKNYGQIVFQENSLSGILIFLALLVNSPFLAIYSLFASILSIAVGHLFTFSNASINAGLIGYNAILCTLVLAQTKIKSLAWVSLGIFVSILILELFNKIEILALTAPFVLSIWVCLALQTSGRKARN